MERIELSETSCRQFKAPAMPPLLKDKRVAGPSQATKYQRATPRFFFEGGKKSSSTFYFVIQNKKKRAALEQERPTTQGFTTPSATVADNSMFEASF